MGQLQVLAYADRLADRSSLSRMVLVTQLNVKDAGVHLLDSSLRMEVLTPPGAASVDWASLSLKRSTALSEREMPLPRLAPPPGQPAWIMTS